jgi:hypothetical protein
MGAWVKAVAEKTSDWHHMKTALGVSPYCG